MRDRRPADWAEDLAARHEIESEVERALRSRHDLDVELVSTRSFDRLDFQVCGPEGQVLQIELKAKRQPLSAQWCALRPDVDPRDLFVLDELALRKIVDGGRRTFLLVRDLPAGRWVLWSAGDLVVASRVRHARVLHKSARPVVKGKLLFDLGETGVQAADLGAVLDELVRTTRRLEALWHDVSPWPAAGGGAS